MILTTKMYVANVARRGWAFEVRMNREAFEVAMSLKHEARFEFALNCSADRRTEKVRESGLGFCGNVGADCFERHVGINSSLATLPLLAKPGQVAKRSVHEMIGTRS